MRIEGTYYSIHEFAGPEERREGRKIGEVLEQGVYVHLPNGQILKIPGTEPRFPKNIRIY
jgi:hypothetical protein